MRLPTMGVMGVAAAIALTLPAWAHASPRRTAGPIAEKAKTPKAKPAKPNKAKATPPKASPALTAPVRTSPGATPPIAVKIPVQRATLENGLRVVLNVDRSAPTVAVAVTYDVGARNEESGRSGFAHLFEHMMFQGSQNVPKGEHFRLVAAHGGQQNGTTNPDRTDYFEVLPAGELALALYLEADRMRSLDVSQQNFENQRKVVQEEYRMRVSNAPFGPSFIRLEDLVFTGFFPYQHPTIGSMADLDAADLAWVKDFHDHHYGPNNAVLSIAGDIDADAAMSLVHRYFDPIPKIAVTPYAAAPLPEQTAPRRAAMEDHHVRSPGLLLGWATPPGDAPDFYALDLAGIVLAGGESSRLYQILVRDRNLCRSVSGGAEKRRGPAIFELDLRLSEGARPAEAERLAVAEIQTLAARGPTEPEYEKAEQRALSAIVFALQTNLFRARRLGEYEAFYGDANLLAGELARYRAVTRDDIRRSVEKYLGPARTNVVLTYPEGQATLATEAEPPTPKRTETAPGGSPPLAQAKKKTAPDAPAKPKRHR